MWMHRCQDSNQNRMADVESSYEKSRSDKPMELGQSEDWQMQSAKNSAQMAVQMRIVVTRTGTMSKTLMELTWMHGRRRARSRKGAKNTSCCDVWLMGTTTVPLRSVSGIIPMTRVVESRSRSLRSHKCRRCRLSQRFVMYLKIE